MNAQQRKFLIDKIQDKTKKKIQELKGSKLQYPSASNYIFKAIMNDKLEIQPINVILNALKEKALRAKEGQNWLSDERMGWDAERTIKMDLKDLVVIPNDYRTEYERVKEYNLKIDEEIHAYQISLDTIEMRIQLASDKTLQNLINEVDDMGELKLIDTKLKMLT